MKRIWKLALAVFVLSGAMWSPPVLAQDGELETVMVFATRGQQNLIDDLKYVGSTTGRDEAQKKAQGEAFLKTINRFFGELLSIKDFNLNEMPGVEPAKPWGAIVRADATGNIIPLAFLPVTEEVKLLDMIKGSRPDQVKEAEGGIYEIGGTQTVFLKIQDGWAYVAQLAEQLDDLPDPVETVGELNAMHDMAVRFHVRKLPEVHRDMVVDMLNQGGGILPVASLPPGSTDGLRLMLTEAEEITFGVSIDAEKQQMAFDLFVEPVAGSGLASYTAKLTDSKTRLGAFVDDQARVMARLSMPLEGELKTHFDKLLADYKTNVMAAIDGASEIQSDKEREIFKEIAGQLVEVIQGGANTGTLDLGMKIVDQKGKMTLIAGAYVGDAAKAKELMQRVAELGTGDPGLKSATVAAETHNGTAIHSFELAALGDTPEMKGLASLLGSPLKLFVAASDDGRLFAAAGANGLEQIKAALDAGEATAPPAQMLVDVRPLLKPLGDMLPQDLKIVPNLLLMNMQQSDARVLMSLEPTSEGVKLHGEARDGFVKVISIAGPFLFPTILNMVKEGGIPGLPALGQ